MSDSLWVRTPGGIRVATDEVLALLEWLESYHRRARALCDEMGRSSGVAQVRQAIDAAHSLEEWSRWMVRSLDVYSQQVAAHEKARSQLFESPRDRALSTLTRVALGRTDLPGSGVEEGAAALLGHYRPAAEVEQVGSHQQTSIPQSIAERIARIPETGTPIRIDSYPLSDGSRHVEVFIAGTAEFTNQRGGSSFDMSSNLALVAGLTSASMIATQKAMVAAGLRATDRVVFVGHSQGGAVAARLAESGRYTTVGLVTVGAPTGSIPVTGNYPALVIEHRDDVVPELGGSRETTDAVVVTAESGSLPGDIIGAHSREGYEATAQRVDESPAQQLQHLRQSLPHSAVGESAVFREREG